MTIQLVANSQELERSKSGTIWGRVYFQVDDRSFPDQGWTDIAIGFTEAWLNALTRILSGACEQTVRFLDGPFAVQLLAEGEDRVAVNFFHKEIPIGKAGALITDLMENAVSVSKSLLLACRQNAWSDNDVTELVLAVRKAEALRSKSPGNWH
jgi:hypothetical protein